MASNGIERPRRRPPQLTPPSLRTSLALQQRTMGALMIRFMITRYGRQNLGFLWLVVEPMLLTAGVMAVWSLLKSPYQHGVQVIAIVLTGYMPMTVWRHMTSSSSHILRASKHLLFHRNITYFDAILSRLSLEFIGVTAAFAAAYTIMVTLKLVSPIYDLGLMLAGWFMMAGLAFGFGTMLAAATEYSEVLEKFIQPLQYLIVPISGCFFMVDWLPYKAQQAVLYMPLVHAYESFRAGFFGPSVATHFSLTYGYLWALGMTAVGFWLIEKVRDRVH
jgi:capsular polysaccharide transport system permease protein